MSSLMDEAVSQLSAKIESFDGSIKFEIEDEGAILIDGDGVRAEDGPADCTLSASVETFKGILNGSVNPTSAFMSGDLKLDGDMGTAMRLAAQL